MAEGKDVFKVMAARARAAWERVAKFLMRGTPERAPEFEKPGPMRRNRALKATGIILGTLLGVFIFAALILPGNAFRPTLASFLSAKLNRDVKIAGDLHMNFLSWNPTADVAGVIIANPDWANGLMADLPKIHVRTRLWPLLWGELSFTEVIADKPQVVLLREANGRANWVLGNSDSNEPTNLPPIRLFVVNEGRLTVDDRQRKVTFDGKISSREDAEGTDSGFSLIGNGHLNRAPFYAEIKGGPLLNVDASKPYTFKGLMRTGATRITANGAIEKPFDLGQFHAAVNFAGPDMADLYYILGLTFPNTPPYNLSGNLERDGEVYHFERFGGHVGDSDLAGNFDVDASQDRPLLTGDLHSKVLDFDDLGPMFGAPPAIGKGETASAPQQQQAKKVAVATRVLPDMPLQIERVRQMDANITYKAETVKSQDFPLRGVSLKLDLDNGLLKLDPVTFEFARGVLNGNVAINARGAVPETDMDVRVTGLKLEQFLPVSSGEPAIEGTAVARAKIHGLGNSIRRAAATADGTVTLVLPSGKIRRSFAELLGINLSSGLVLLLTGDETQTDIRCGVAHFEAKKGVMTLQQFVFDTNVVLASGEGTLDLRNEQLDMALTGHSKKPRLLRLRAPITITGPMSSPSIGVKAETAIVQGGIAAGLAFVLSPLAAILPFVDPALAEDASCKAVLTQAKAQGAPKVPIPAVEKKS